MKVRKEDMRLYAVTDRSWLGEKTLYEQLEEALQGGVTFVQLREKAMSEEEFLEEAKLIKGLCKKYSVPLIINDKVEIAIACDADGVHVGQSDMKAESVRDKLGPDKIIGVSARTVEQALSAQQQGADYIGSGACFATNTKQDASVIGREELKRICKAVDIPVVAIGGISEENVLELQGSGIAGIAVVSAIFAKENIKEAAEKLRELSERIISE